MDTLKKPSRSPWPIETFIMGATFLVGAGYGIATRTPEDFLDYPLLGAYWIFAILATFVCSKWAINIGAEKSKNVGPKQWLFLLVWCPLASCAIAIIYYGMGVALKDMYLWAVRPDSLRPLLLLATGAVSVMLGAMLFMIRLSSRCLYGFTEVIMGVVMAVHRVSQDIGKADPWGSGTLLTVLTAGVYLVVRGLDNMHVGLTKEPFDRIAIRIKRLLFES